MSCDFSGDFANKVLTGLGGKANLKFLDNCITRLRVVLKDNSLVNEDYLINETGAKKIIFENDEVHIIYGLRILEIRKALDEEIDKISNQDEKPTNAKRILEYLGGSENIQNLDSCITRLRVVLKDPQKINEEGLLKETGAVKVIRNTDDTHIVYGVRVDDIRNSVETELNSK